MKDIGSAEGIQSYRWQGYEGAMSGKCFCDFPVPLDFMARLILPQILSENFADYETLMADMAEDPTPRTLPCMPEIASETPHSTAHKRSMGNPAAWDETTSGVP